MSWAHNARQGGVARLPDDLRIKKAGTDEVWEVPRAAPTRYLSHDYFRYIGKFPPQIARHLILSYMDAGHLVVDPMCGGGTTLIEARLTGRRSAGFDVNPVSVLISSVATRALPSQALGAAVREFTNGLREGLACPGQAGTGATTLLDMHGHEKYFDEPTHSALRVFFSLLPHVAAPEHRDFLLLALLAVLRSVSHANVKKMNLELDLEKKTRRALLPAFTAKLQRMLAINTLLEASFVGPAPMVCTASAGHVSAVRRGSADLVVLHPPYLTNTAFSEVTELQLAVLGISHLSIWRRELRNRGTLLHEPDGLRKYIVGWNRILGEACRLLRPGGHCAVVVGDGQIDYTRIPMASITAELAGDIGFELVARARHHLNNNTGRTLSRKMRHQHVLVFRKQEPVRSSRRAPTGASTRATTPARAR